MRDDKIGHFYPVIAGRDERLPTFRGLFAHLRFLRFTIEGWAHCAERKAVLKVIHDGLAKRPKLPKRK